MKTTESAFHLVVQIHVAIESGLGDRLTNEGRMRNLQNRRSNINAAVRNVKNQNIFTNILSKLA